MSRLEEYGKFDDVAKDYDKEREEEYVKAREEVQKHYKPKFDELFPDGLVSDKIKDPRKNPLLNPDSPHLDDKTKEMIAKQREQQEIFGDLLGSIDKNKAKKGGGAKAAAEEAEEEEDLEKIRTKRNPGYQPPMKENEERSLVPGDEGAVMKKLVSLGVGTDAPKSGAICQIVLKTTFVEEEDDEDDEDEDEEEDDDIVYKTPEEEEVLVYDYIKLVDRLKDEPTEDGVARKMDWVCYRVENLRDPKGVKPEASALAWCLQGMKEYEKCEVVYTGDSSYGYDFPDAPIQVPPGTKLKSEIELVEWYDEVYIEDDPSVVKRTTKKGGDGSGLGWAFGKDITHCSVKLLEGGLGRKDGEEKDIGDVEWGIQSPMEGYEIPPAVLYAIRQMKIHEIAEVYVYSDEKNEKMMPKGFREAHGLREGRLVYEVHFFRINKVRELVNGEAEMTTLRENKKAGYNYPIDYQEVEVRIRATRHGGDNDGELVFIVGQPGKYEKGVYVDGIEVVRLNSGQVPRAVDEALMHMRKREKAVVIAKPLSVFDTPEGKLVAEATGVSDEVLATLVGENGDELKIEIEVEDILPRVKPYKLSVDKRIEYMESVKDIGNKLFKAGAIDLAQKKYETAAKVITSVSYYAIEDEDERKKTLPIRSILQLNIASCLTKKGMFKEALEKCEEALKIDRDFAKAYIRRATIYINMDLFDKAKQDLLHAKNIDPKVPGLRHETSRLAKKIEESKKKVKKSYSGFLNKDGSTLADSRSSEVPKKEEKKNNWSKGTNDWLAKAKEFYGLQDFDTESFMPDELKPKPDKTGATDSLPEPAAEDQIKATADES